MAFPKKGRRIAVFERLKDEGKQINMHVIFGFCELAGGEIQGFRFCSKDFP